jgi:uncharacterized membrane protein AbrB (regulator of aidB expression)
MTLMADARGADARLVTFMHYLRIVLVMAIASVVAKVFGASAHAAHTISSFLAIAGLNYT